MEMGGAGKNKGEKVATKYIQQSTMAGGGDGRHNGNINRWRDIDSDGRHDGDATATTSMDSVRNGDATTTEGALAT